MVLLTLRRVLCELVSAERGFLEQDESTSWLPSKSLMPSSHHCKYRCDHTHTHTHRHPQRLQPARYRHLYMHTSFRSMVYFSRTKPKGFCFIMCSSFTNDSVDLTVLQYMVPVPIHKLTLQPPSFYLSEKLFFLCRGVFVHVLPSH